MSIQLCLSRLVQTRQISVEQRDALLQIDAVDGSARECLQAAVRTFEDDGDVAEFVDSLRTLLDVVDCGDLLPANVPPLLIRAARSANAFHFAAVCRAFQSTQNVDDAIDSFERIVSLYNDSKHIARRRTAFERQALQHNDLTFLLRTDAELEAMRQTQLTKIQGI